MLCCLTLMEHYRGLIQMLRLQDTAFAEASLAVLAVDGNMRNLQMDKPRWCLVARKHSTLCDAKHDKKIRTRFYQTT